MKLFLKPYYLLKSNWFVWLNIANALPRAQFFSHKKSLTLLQKRLVEKVEKDGITVTTLDELFPGEDLLSTLQNYIAALPEDVGQQNKKTFLRHYWPLDVALDLTNPFLRFALSPTVLDIANSYMGMWTRLKHYTVNRTIPVPPTEAPQFSQRWHRDPQEKRMIKAFIYLSDVDEGCGPFTYVLRSTYGKTYGSLFPQKPPEGSYPATEDVERLVDPKDMRVMTGKAGTVIFCDTTGLHRGGYATRGERLMFTSFYPAPSYIDATWYTTPPTFDRSSLSEEARFALHL